MSTLIPCLANAKSTTAVTLEFYKVGEDVANPCTLTKTELDAVALDTLSVRASLESLEDGSDLHTENLSPWGLNQSNDVPFEFSQETTFNLFFSKYQSSQSSVNAIRALIAQNTLPNEAFKWYVRVSIVFGVDANTGTDTRTYFGLAMSFKETINKPSHKATLVVRGVATITSNVEDNYKVTVV